MDGGESMTKTEIKTKLLRDPRSRAQRRAAKGGKRPKTKNKIQSVVKSSTAPKDIGEPLQ
jgi:hypothetical protein